MQDIKKIKTAVVGLGRIGWQFHLPQIASHEGFELVGVTDPLQERLDEAKKIYGVNGYQNYSDMLKAEKPRLVVVASPTKFHCEQTVQAFENGCDVFCEKPVVLSLAEMRKILEYKQSRNRKFMAYQPHRGYRETVALQHILSLGLLGDVYMHKRACSAYARRSDWQAFISHGGGMLNNYGTHFIDQLVYLAKSEIVDIKCQTQKIASLGDAEDVVKVLMVASNGIILDLDINMATAFQMTPWQVYGNHGTAVLNHNVWQVKFFNPDELEDVNVQSTLAAEGRSYANGEKIPWRLKEFDIEDFEPVCYYDKCYDYFSLGKEPFVDIEESRLLLEIIEKCREDAVATNTACGCK
jgi:scyllo-inositol 2-dehydrogenase (NADP+)